MLELRNLLRSVLLAEEGRCKLHEQLERYSWLVTIVLVQLLICFAFTVATACAPPLQKMGGFMFIYVLVPQLQVCLCAIFWSHLYLAENKQESPGRHSNPFARVQRVASSQKSSIVQVLQDGVSALAHGDAAEQVEVCRRGVSVKFLERFAKDFHTGGLSTKEVCEQIVIPATEAAKCSVWEALYAVEHGVARGRGKHCYTGSPSCFVSHAWLYEFNELVDILKTYVENLNRKSRDVYFFLDMIAMNQHQLAEAVMSRAIGKSWSLDISTTKSNASDVYAVVLQNLTTSLKASGKVLLALDTWNRPVALSRAWCLYEIYVAHSIGLPLSVGFSRNSARALDDGLAIHEKLIEKILSSIDARAAQATVEADREMILGLIMEIGVDSFNAFILEKLRSALKALVMSRRAQRSGLFHPSKTLTFDNLRSRKTRRGKFQSQLENAKTTDSVFSSGDDLATIPSEALLTACADFSTVAPAVTLGATSPDGSTVAPPDAGAANPSAGLSDIRVIFEYPINL